MTANRGQPNYATARHTRVRLVQAAAFDARPSAGVVVEDAGAAQVLDTGYNTEAGSVVQWENVRAGPAGSIRIESSWAVDAGGDHPENRKAYAMAALRLEQSPTPWR